MMNLGIPPNQLGWLQRYFLRLISRPSWARLSRDHGLDWFFRAERDLKKNGIVVLGTYIQANELLYERGRLDCPGELLFSLAPEADGDTLCDVAHNLFSLKGRPGRDGEEDFFSRYLANEMQRVQGVKLSRRLSPFPQTYVSTTVFYRSHLPERKLSGRLYPLLVSPETKVAMVLPKKYWTEEGHALYSGEY